MGKVDYTLENMLKCTCGKCPVQSYNACFKERTGKIQKMEAKGVDTVSLLEPEEFPWLYCATCKATCSNFSFEEECVCKDCDVWKENDLKENNPTKYYCRDGKAR
ncbi:DUF2769 domain-containing protein [Methanobacterium paludis]|uniref:DUF2769 domain-containing protein n=1 Tax=Methanobacterium paludis (strain DSM 25820 / JCM 18151 / SWAN1) TaxID=868131 RepID=F6D236_METPW|nr:DUF2769 domain-containing protein [Methanobacterium paludis]AEG17902.1 hypothetical protein MSWAN_0877 [Methanobacterium paludis]